MPNYPPHRRDSNEWASTDAPGVSVFPPRPSTPAPPSPYDLGARRRRGWATVALVLSLLAILVETAFHLCATMLFDPLPDVATGFAYAGVLFALCFNEITLNEAARPGANPLISALGLKRATGLALAVSSVALLVTAMVTWMFLPFLVAFPLLLISVVGTLLLCPALDLIVLIAQFRALLALWRSFASDVERRRLAAGIGALVATAFFTLIVRPMLIGHETARALHATGENQQAAFADLRYLRGESAMLDLTYRRNPAYWVCFGYKAGTAGVWPWTGYGWDGLGDDVTKARRDYFLLTGVPFESVPRPDSEAHQNQIGQPDDVAVEETGGYVVGRPVPGVSLDASAMEFTVDDATETTTGTWTMTFRNRSDTPQEARADILLPPGGTCHAVSLWINGVERPAAFSSPQKVRTAYQQIAVVQRRDPLLVTMPAPDHLLAQCFPVPPKGAMKIKLGITAPLQWRTARADERRETRLLWTCPTFGPVDFTVPSRLTHSLALRTPTGDSLTAPDLRGADIFSPPTVDVSATRTAPHRGDDLSPRVVRIGDPFAPPVTPIDLYLLGDASEGMNGLLRDVSQGRHPLTPARETKLQAELQAALATLPKGSRVVAYEDTMGANIGDSRHSADYAGGTDPAPALERMLRRAREAQTAARPAVVVFLHAASPANVSDLSGVRRELQRGIGESGPTLVSVQLASESPDAVAMDLAGFPSVYARRALPGDDSALTDALRFAAQTTGFSGSFKMPAEPNDYCALGGHRPAVNGNYLFPPPDDAAEPEAVARLRQASRTTADWYRANLTANFDQAVDLRVAAGAPAARAHLITPLSSAVVLETEEEYEENGLKDPADKKGENAKSEKSEKQAAAKKAADEVNANAPEPPAGALAAVGLCIAFGTLRLYRVKRKMR